MIVHGVTKYYGASIGAIFATVCPESPDQRRAAFRGPPYPTSLGIVHQLPK